MASLHDLQFLTARLAFVRRLCFKICHRFSFHRFIAAAKSQNFEISKIRIEAYAQTRVPGCLAPPRLASAKQARASVDGAVGPGIRFLLGG